MLDLRSKRFEKLVVGFRGQIWGLILGGLIMGWEGLTWV